jgi:predicted nucleic acid-binding Zn ribbon protein
MSMIPIGDDARDDGRCKVACLTCGTDFEPAGRSRHCSQRCRQRAYRLRRRQAQQAILVDLATAALRRQRQLVAQTVYQCPACEERYLGERRCSECNLMCRKLGLGGRCSGCDEILTVGDLIGFELDGGHVVA